MIECSVITSVDGNLLQAGQYNALEDITSPAQNPFIYLLGQMLGFPPQSQAGPDKCPKALGPDIEPGCKAEVDARPRLKHTSPARSYIEASPDRRPEDALKALPSSAEEIEWKSLLRDMEAEPISNAKSKDDTEKFQFWNEAEGALSSETPPLEAPTQQKNAFENTEEFPGLQNTAGHLISAKTAEGLNHTVETHSSGIRHLERIEQFEKTFHIIQDGNRLLVSLEPEGMGKLDIKLSLEKGVLHALVQVQDDQARNLMENNMQQLIETLTREGLNVGGFMVSLGKNSPREHDADKARSETERGSEKAEQANNNKKIEQQGMVSIFA